MAYSNEKGLDIEDELSDYVVDGMRSAGINFLRNVTIASPRDTGRFQSNWAFSVGDPDDRTYLRRTNYSNNIRRQSNKVKSSKIETDSVLWVSNNLPYGPRLNNGWSDQSPAFFVEKAARISGIDIPDGTL